MSFQEKSEQQCPQRWLDFLCRSSSIRWRQWRKERMESPRGRSSPCSARYLAMHFIFDRRTSGCTFSFPSRPLLCSHVAHGDPQLSATADSGTTRNRNRSLQRNKSNILYNTNSISIKQSHPLRYRRRSLSTIPPQTIQQIRPTRLRENIAHHRQLLRFDLSFLCCLRRERSSLLSEGEGGWGCRPTDSIDARS